MARKRSFQTFQTASRTIRLDIFDSPTVRSTNTMGISAIFFVFDPEDLEMSRFEATMMGALLGGLGFVFFVMYLVPYVLPRRPWVWVYDIVLIAIGLTSCLTLPLALPLLIFWLKPEPKAWFGRV